ncbi:MAG: DNA-directed DNA polymerase [Nanoarchaeota archaeon]
MHLKFYPYDFDYKVEDQTYFYLYGKLENGQKIVVKHPYQPYFYALLGGVDQEALVRKLTDFAVDTAKVTHCEAVEKELLGKKLPFLKIYTNYPKAVPLIAQELQEQGIKSYEKDILFVHRYLRDNKIIPMSLTEAAGEYLTEPKEQGGQSERMRIPIFLAKTVVQNNSSVLLNWNILAFDIETYALKKEINSFKNPILMISFYGKNFQKVITWKKFNHQLDYLEVVADEAELIKRFKEVILEQQPEILTGYYSDGFDFPYLLARAEKYHISLDLGMDYSELTVRHNDAKIKGIAHLDVFKFIKNIFGKNLKSESFSLDAVSQELLNHQKHKVNLDKLAYVWDNEPDKLVTFCEYNLHDSRLTYQLCEKLLPDMIEFTGIIGLPTFDLIRLSFSRLVENYILKRAIEYNVIAPNKPDNEEVSQRMEESIQGAFVYEPTPGLYSDIIVFDFRSLYPTIITAHNIGPEGFRCSCCKDKSPVPGREQYWFCQKEKKFIPSLLEKLILLRSGLKKQIKEAKQQGANIPILEAQSYALKILANSFYGYLGFYAARWYCLECAASTTAYARNYIKETIEKAEQRGFKVIYADTDSCFLLLGNKTMDDVNGFMDEVNANLPGQMELEMEGQFPRGIFVAQKSTEKGAKKKYALLTEKGGIKITGFESVRRNWSLLAKEVQTEVLGLVLQGQEKEALTYVKKIVQELKAGKIELSKLILKMQITREISQYHSFGPHIKVAEDLIARGEEIRPGAVIEYVIKKGSGLVRERAGIPDEVTDYDAEYYIRHQVVPAVASILAVFGYAEEELFCDSRQTGLGKYF